jgi:hypothetical protein
MDQFGVWRNILVVRGCINRNLPGLPRLSVAVIGELFRELTGRHAKHLRAVRSVVLRDEQVAADIVLGHT